MQALIDFIESILVWLKDLLLWLPLKLYELLLDGLAFVIEAIPVPSFLASAPGFVGGIDPTVVFYLDGFAFAEGLAIVISATLIRFLIRRIPLIG